MNAILLTALALWVVSALLLARGLRKAPPLPSARKSRPAVLTCPSPR